MGIVQSVPTILLPAPAAAKQAGLVCPLAAGCTALESLWLSLFRVPGRGCRRPLSLLSTPCCKVKDEDEYWEKEMQQALL